MRNSWSRGVAALVAIALGAAASNVQAGAPSDDRTVLAWTVEVDASLEAAARSELATGVRTGLQRASATVVTVDPARAAEAAACTDAPCISAIARAQGVRWVVRPQVHIDDRNFTITATLLDANDGSVVGTVDATCELCGTAEVAEELAHQVATLAGKLDRVEPDPAQLVLGTDPDGAEISVDGRSVGRSPQSLRLTPGRHRLEVRKPGFVAIDRSVDLVAGVRETLTLELERSRRPLLGVGLGVMFGGVALAAAGAPLWALDGRPYRGRCSGDDVDYAGRCRFDYDTKAAGTALVSVGIAAVVTGIVLIALQARRRR
jgi:hypothetical protein